MSTKICVWIVHCSYYCKFSIHISIAIVSTLKLIIYRVYIYECVKLPHTKLNEKTTPQRFPQRSRNIDFWELWQKIEGCGGHVASCHKVNSNQKHCEPITWWGKHQSISGKNWLNSLQLFWNEIILALHFSSCRVICRHGCIWLLFCPWRDPKSHFSWT